MRRFFTTMLAVVLVAGLLGPAQAKAAVVWEDEEGDADMQQGLGGSIPAGFDLLQGELERNGSNIEFTVTHADMPPNGSFPESFRFLWAFAVGKESYRITAKSADIGKPDVLAGETTERVGTVSPTGHFRLEGNCGAGETIGVLQPINCEPLEYVEGEFDPASQSFTVSIPMESIKAKPRSRIGPGAGDSTGICQICWVTHTVERSLQSTIVDAASMTKVWRVPKK